MIKIKECVGINTFTSKTGKKGTQIYYLEPFDQNMENALGMKTGEIFTYNEVSLNVGDKFKAFYDSFTFNGESRPVLAEIQIVDKKIK